MEENIDNKDIRTMFNTTNEIKFMEEKTIKNPKGAGRKSDPNSVREQRKRKREEKKLEIHENIIKDNENENNDNDNYKEKKISTLERNKMERKKFMELCMKKENMDVEAKSTVYHHMQWNWDACDEIVADDYNICYKKLMKIRKYVLTKLIKVLKWPIRLVVWNIEKKRRLPRDQLLHRDHFHIHAFLLFVDTFEYCAERWRWEVTSFFEEQYQLEPDNISFHNREHGIHYCLTYVTKYTWIHEPVVDLVDKTMDYPVFLQEQVDLDAKADITNKVVFKDTHEFNDIGNTIIDQENIAIRGFDCLCYRLEIRWIDVYGWHHTNVEKKLGEKYDVKRMGTVIWKKKGLCWNAIDLLMQLNNEILITHFIRKYGRILLKIIKNCDYCKIHFQKYQNNDDLIEIIQEEQYDKYDDDNDYLPIEEE